MFWKKSLKEVLNAKKKVTINGVQFVLKKVDPLDHAKGLRVMRSTFETFSIKGDNAELTDGQLKKIREHYRDVFLSAVVKPKLSVKDEDDSVCVDEIFLDQELTEKLYMEIMFHTYGKKKLMSSLSIAAAQSS